MYHFKVNFTNFVCDREFVIISPNQFPVDILKMVIPEVLTSKCCRAVNQTSKKKFYIFYL